MVAKDHQWVQLPSVGAFAGEWLRTGSSRQDLPDGQVAAIAVDIAALDAVVCRLAAGELDRVRRDLFAEGQRITAETGRVADRMADEVFDAADVELRHVDLRFGEGSGWVDAAWSLDGRISQLRIGGDAR